MLSHEVGNLWISLDLSGGFRSLPPGEVISLRQGSSSSSFPWVSSMLGQVASLPVADEALAVSDVLRSFAGREIDLIHVHGVGIGARGLASWRNIAVSPSLEFPKLYHVLVKLSCLVEPLFPLPSHFLLSIRESSGSHHDGKLLGYSLLEGIYQDAVVIYSTTCLSQLESSGVLIKVSIELVHTEGINGLVGSVFQVFWDESFFKGLA